MPALRADMHPGACGFLEVASMAGQSHALGRLRQLPQSAMLCDRADPTFEQEQGYGHPGGDQGVAEEGVSDC